MWQWHWDTHPPPSPWWDYNRCEFAEKPLSQSMPPSPRSLRPSSFSHLAKVPHSGRELKNTLCDVSIHWTALMATLWYNGHIQWSYSMVIFNDHIQWSYSMVKFNGHIQWSCSRRWWWSFWTACSHGCHLVMVRFDGHIKLSSTQWMS